jgi:hypothetical protein
MFARRRADGRLLFLDPARARCHLCTTFSDALILVHSRNGGAMQPAIFILQSQGCHWKIESRFG